ncbi:hypothetical protein AAG570_013765 [Ranatra chinensis]|uniref:Uncharacterized protein n=1 Tax=Ranatra chinensis TaxID=642074 RepID=A0ABD0YD47_9HEMI
MLRIAATRCTGGFVRIKIIPAPRQSVVKRRHSKRVRQPPLRAFAPPTAYCSVIEFLTFSCESTAGIHFQDTYVEAMSGQHVHKYVQCFKPLPSGGRGSLTHFLYEVGPSVTQAEDGAQAPLFYQDKKQETTEIGARDIMMAPSVEQRCTTAGGGGVANTDNSKTGTNNAANIFLVASNNEMNMGAESNDKLNR